MFSNKLVAFKSALEQLEMFDFNSASAVSKNVLKNGWTKQHAVQVVEKYLLRVLQDLYSAKKSREKNTHTLPKTTSNIAAKNGGFQ